jgi:hypothetical protein
MSSDLYKIAYCSRSQMRGTHAEVTDGLLSLLACARAKNARLGITGALLSQAGLFAQVLEGPQDSVENLFSLVQLDDRNTEVTVAFRGPETERDFPKWSMAFAGGEESSSSPAAQAAIHAVLANKEGSGENLLAMLKSFVVQNDSFLL